MERPRAHLHVVGLQNQTALIRPIACKVRIRTESPRGVAIARSVIGPGPSLAGNPPHCGGYVAGENLMGRPTRSRRKWMSTLSPATWRAVTERFHDARVGERSGGDDDRRHLVMALAASWGALQSGQKDWRKEWGMTRAISAGKSL